MKLFIKKIFNKFKILNRSIFFLRYNHKKNIISTNNPSIIFNNVPIINIENDKEWKLKSEKSELISSLLQKENNNETDYPLIESWLKLKNRTYAPNNFFINQQYKNIYPNLNKNNIFYKKKIYILPYYTSVFGHFAGDVLGNILYYLKFIVKKNKLLVISPSKFWDTFLEKIFPNKIYFIKPKIAFKYNIIFFNSLILPRMNTIQNFIISKNILDKYLVDKKLIQKNIFVTSGSDNRISNIKEVINFFQNKNYEIVFPHKIPIEELLIKIKYSKILVSEKGSIINNIHLCRTKHYYILSSKNEIIKDNKRFSYAGIYKSLHKGLYEDIYCDDDPPYQNLIPYKKRIKVDISLLNKKLNNKKD
jgi:hypothetical protein